MLEKPTISKTQFPIESLLSARLLLEPQIVGDRIYFLSDLAGTLSLYSIASSGSIPEPLLPGGLALVNPHIMPGEVKSLGTSIYGNACNGVSSDHSTVILADGYTAGDVVLYYWKEGMTTRKLLYGVPLDQRDGEQVPLTGIGWCSFVDNNKGLFFESTIFHDNGGLTYLSLDDPSKPIDVPIKGLRHSGVGEMAGVRRVKGDVFVLEYNIDGASWAYEGRFHSGTPPTFEVERVLIGNQPLSGGVVLGLEWQIKNEKPLQVEYVFSFTRANSPSQIYHIPIGQKVAANRLSSEKVLGIPDEYLSAGEDASYTSFDGLRVSARLYLPSSKLGHKGPRPLVEYVHGGPQGQERPDFTWFSMPLIQYLTLNGFAVFVPNVRGSTGYGMRYMKWVDKDWLVERSPKTYMNQLSAPLMILQGKHDPRVPEPESAQLVKDLRDGGVKVDYVVYEDEGHDVLRFKNRVHCYNTITEFFRRNLGN